jgi:small-conductance mechanosensitive channel
VRAEAIVALESGLLSANRGVTSSLEIVREAQAARRSRLFEPDQPPLWAARPVTDSEGAIERIREDWQRDLETLGAFLELRSDRAVQHLMLFLAMLLAALALRRRVARWSAEDPELGEAAHVFRYPVSVALLVGLLSTPAFHPLAPGIVHDLGRAALLIPALRLLPPLVERPFRPLVYALAAFYLSAQVRELIEGAPLLSRYLFTAEAFVAWLIRPARLVKIEGAGSVPPALGVAARLILLILALAFAANLLGYLAFAQILGRGILGTIYAAVIFYGGYRIARVFLSVALHTDTARRLGMVRVGGPSIERWSARLLRILAALWWFEATLDSFTIRDPVLGGLRSVVTTPLRVGAVSLSLSDLLAFAATIGAAVLLSRLIRFVLEEDVFPRVVLRRGVPNAVSTSIHYVLLVLGFMLAVAAAGMDLSRLALLAGAFGVGIGFGLQNVVNNFVSGLILLFERPIQVGDTIEVGGLLGDVRSIGIRASTVRTVDGAEVIIPNGSLISDQVINWTLSDRRRRVIVKVGVAYGTDPEKVLKILSEVAQTHPTVLDDPKPQADFLGFGDSSLDFQLRCWIPRFEEGFGMRSALAIAINAQLRDAGIQIPFPQRDLHVRSIDPETTDRLRKS